MQLREPISAGTHLLGAVAALIGGIYLVCSCDGTWLSVIGTMVYSLAMTALFLVSGLLHGLNCSEKTLMRLERMDYAGIYLFIAGTYTPVMLRGLPSELGHGLLITEWVLALIGVWLSLVYGPAGKKFQVVLFLAMGWSFAFAMPSLFAGLSAIAFNMLLLGGAFYTVGALIYALDWPHIKLARVTAHDLWHVLVLLGSAAHYAMVFNLVAGVS